MVEMEQVVLPGLIEQLEEQALLGGSHQFGAVISRLLSHFLVGGAADALFDLGFRDAFFLGPFVDGQVEVQDTADFLVQAIDVPLLGIGVRRDGLLDHLLDRFVPCPRWCRRFPARP